MAKPVLSASLHRQLGSVAARLLAAVRVVLVSPSHPGNIGAAARAMATMGLGELTVVAPRHPAFADHDEARAFAGHGLDRLVAARTAGTLAEAVADCQIVVGVSAEPREFGPLPRTPGRTVREAFDLIGQGAAARVAFVFGTERTGLSIDEVGLCQWLTTIPAEPQRSSLNLGQAVQIIAYALREAALERNGDAAPAEPGAAGSGAARRADHAAIEGFFAHLERAMVACGFLDPAVPKRLMPRMRRLFGRAGLDVEEVDLLRGLCTRIERTAHGERIPSGERTAHGGPRAADGRRASG